MINIKEQLMLEMHEIYFILNILYQVNKFNPHKLELCNRFHKLWIK